MAIETSSRWLPRQETHQHELQDICLNDEVKDPNPLPVGDRPEVLRNIVHECLFVGLIAFSAASSVFLQRSIVVLAAQIGNSLKMNPAEVAWSTAASGLTTGAFLIPFGHLADICVLVSRKNLLLLSLAAFSLLLAFTSFAPSGIVLDVMTGLAGMACAATIPVAVGILSLAYPVSSRRKNIVFSTFMMGNPAATIIGGLSSGSLASSFNWKAPFISLAILYATITILIWIVVPNVDEPSTTQKDQEEEAHLIDLGSSFSSEPNKPGTMELLLQFDWIGSFLLLVGVLLFTVALTIGPERTQQWKTPTEMLLLILGFLSLGCFAVWEVTTKRPMIPPTIWGDLNLTLVIVSVFSCAMAYYSAVFWISMFLQRIENLEAFEVAIRLLPQALMGLFFTPLAGLFMHRIPGTILLAVAGVCSVASNILLVFVHHGDNYFAWILPSLMFSTVGMDWTMNVGSLYILSALPLEHHSIGASLLQTATRLAIPLGIAVTTAVWSSYNGMGDNNQPRLAYTHVFITTTAFAGLSLILVPLIRIGKLGQPACEVAKVEDTDDHKSSRRWSIGASISSTGTISNDKPPPHSFSLLSGSTKVEHGDRSNHEETTCRTARGEKVVWVVCEQCNTSQKSASPKGDPSRYFNDIEFQPPGKQSHNMIMSGSRGRFPSQKFQDLNF